MALGIALFVVAWRSSPSSAASRSRRGVQGGAGDLRGPLLQEGDPNDQGIGWNRAHVARPRRHGFGLAALVGIPLGFVIGRFRFLGDMAAPIIALLKPVSPLAWLPIGLLLFKAANPRRSSRSSSARSGRW
jgi:nitrate/nitrite transport system permease protein